MPWGNLCIKYILMGEGIFLPTRLCVVLTSQLLWSVPGAILPPVSHGQAPKRGCWKAGEEDSNLKPTTICYIVCLTSRSYKCSLFSLEEILVSSKKMEWCKLETQHVPRKVHGLGEPGTGITWESVFPFRLWINCVPVCHPRTALLSLLWWEWSRHGGRSQRRSMEAPECWSCGGFMVLAEWAPETPRNSEILLLWMQMTVSWEGAGWIPKGLQTTSFPHPTQQPSA